MEGTLMELLERFDKAHPKMISREELKSFGFDDAVVEHALHERLLTQHPYLNNARNEVQLMLTKDGFSLLINIRAKKSIDTLDESIREFNKSSDNLARKIWYGTAVIALFTVGIAILAYLSYVAILPK